MKRLRLPPENIWRHQTYSDKELLFRSMWNIWLVRDFCQCHITRFWVFLWFPPIQSLSCSFLKLANPDKQVRTDVTAISQSLPALTLNCAPPSGLRPAKTVEEVLIKLLYNQMFLPRQTGTQTWRLDLFFTLLRNRPWILRLFLFCLSRKDTRWLIWS